MTAAIQTQRAKTDPNLSGAAFSFGVLVLLESIAFIAANSFAWAGHCSTGQIAAANLTIMGTAALLTAHFYHKLDPKKFPDASSQALETMKSTRRMLLISIIAHMCIATIINSLGLAGILSGVNTGELSFVGVMALGLVMFYAHHCSSSKPKQSQDKKATPAESPLLDP
jgi:hypothetical protein